MNQRQGSDISSSVHLLERYKGEHGELEDKKETCTGALTPSSHVVPIDSALQPPGQEGANE